MRQKLDYVHDNPVSGKWNLAATAVDYKHRSAKFYIAEENGIYLITNYLKLEDINLTKPLGKDAESTASTQGCG